ncbi:MAG: hypothetical protein C0613_12560 [Desulfobulbaceae bacterium]|nr:MAG: hypothetical protein C0613_12560 [Desulfobulbaceae bacterium]
MNSSLIREILAIHFEPENGTPYWLERQESLGFDIVNEIDNCHDLYRLGPMDINALRTRPLVDFIPRRFQSMLPELLLSETGGTTGDPCRRVFSPQEFEHAFVRPWQAAVERFSFPCNGTWLFVGPGGPHIIDRSARAMARAVGSLEPFTVDCDVRWIKRQAPGSLGLNLYLDHVLGQAMNIINHQQIDSLFTTPPLLSALAERMSESQRRAIRGIHTGGLALTAEKRPALLAFFPNAVILPGFGNSLFGVTFPAIPIASDEEDVFMVGDDSLWLQLAPLPVTSEDEQELGRQVEPGQRGRIIVHRFDSTFLIVNLPERDTAIATPLAQGGTGLAGIAPLQFATPEDRQGVY